MGLNSKSFDSVSGLCFFELYCVFKIVYSNILLLQQ